MKKPVGLATLMILTAAFSAGCALGPGNQTQVSSLLVKTLASQPVYIDGERVGSTNELIPNLKPGLVSVSIGSPDGPEWMGELSLDPGQCLTFDPVDEEAGSGLSADADESGSKSIDPQGTPEYIASLTSDFASRDKLPQTTIPQSSWYKYGTYGPPAAIYPKVYPPIGTDATTWKRDRIIETAKKYIGTPYRHKHLPMLGLDCSNFTAWTYNYGLGIKFTSTVSTQAQTVGRLVGPSEALERGDLLYYKDTTTGRINHAAIYIDPVTYIDESSNNATGVMIKTFRRTSARFAYARRVIE